MTPTRRAQYETALKSSLQAGYDILKGGGSSLDAVEAAVRVMEDCPLFNAGKGAVFSRDGKNLLEACIIDGQTGASGAATLVGHLYQPSSIYKFTSLVHHDLSIAQLTTVKNPITLARAVMERTPHTILGADDAEQLARDEGLEIVDPEYFWTGNGNVIEHRWKQHIDEPWSPTTRAVPCETGPGTMGTVGACAVDQAGRCAAATSTGGRNNKWTGRIGDTPLPNLGSVSTPHLSISGTGNGEIFIRHAVAHDIMARVKYTGVDLDTAAKAVVGETKEGVEAWGGVVGVDVDGNVTMPFNTEGMYRGFIKEDGVAKVAIFIDDEWW
ncbi:hypothetical protein HK104_006187 [Borealophlyctis nickersoniae]|nr:hypothetical protein HK104_006187 [Borealophlyctis nickersoniae]